MALQPTGIREMTSLTHINFQKHDGQERMKGALRFFNRGIPFAFHRQPPLGQRSFRRQSQDQALRRLAKSAMASEILIR